VQWKRTDGSGRVAAVAGAARQGSVSFHVPSLHGSSDLTHRRRDRSPSKFVTITVVKSGVCHVCKRERIFSCKRERKKGYATPISLRKGAEYHQQNQFRFQLSLSLPILSLLVVRRAPCAGHGKNRQQPGARKPGAS